MSSPSSHENSNLVDIELRSGFAVVRVNNPPVNALSQAVRARLVEIFQDLASNSSVKGIVLSAVGRTFMAGADIREFDGPAQPPFFPELVGAIEAAPQPTVAALFGTALGGGFECALACDFRVIDEKGRVGLPEVTLGFIPGAGGTQWALRLAGFEAAVDLVTTGRMASADEALEMGLVDLTVNGDPIEAALTLIEQTLRQSLPHSKARSLDTTPPEPALVAKLKAGVTKRARGQDAPLRALDLLVDTAGLSFEDGLKKERSLFLELRESDQSRALRHVFFAERSGAQTSELSDTEPRSLAKIGVVGGGLMGSGIAYAALLKGYAVTVVEQNEEALTRTRQRLDDMFAASIKRGRLTANAQANHEEQLFLTQEMAALADADLVIEAAFEDIDTKAAIFKELDAITRIDTVLASNTSYLDLDQIAQAVADPARVLGLHFFSPAHVMRLLEVVRSEKTSPDVLATGLSFGRKLGKVSVVTGVCEGFCGNRILKAYRMIAEFMVEDGALPHEVDAAMTEFGFPMGPFAVQDMAGLEIAYANRKQQNAELTADRRTPGLLECLVEAGRLGQKTGAGWYRYSDGARQGEPDPEAEALILAASAENGRSRSSFSPDQIRRRLLGAMINEGARILEEGIVSRPSDIDLVLVHGYGFPRHRGGPMFYASQVGVDRILQDVRELHRAYGSGWEPARALVEGRI